MYRTLDMFKCILIRFSFLGSIWNCYIKKKNYTKRKQILTPENQTEENTKQFVQERKYNHCILYI